MNTAIIIGLIIVLIAIFLFNRSERRRERHVYDMANKFEKNKNYEAACFYYALAMSAGHDRKSSEIKIKELWQSHGPFDFKKQLQEAKSEACSYESCGEGIYALTVADIQKIVTAN